MISLAILIGGLVLSFLFSAWAVAFTARIAGSTRGTLRFGLLAMVGILVIDILMNIVGAGFHVHGDVQRFGVGCGLLALELSATFIVLRRTFALSGKRTWAPFGGYVGAALVCGGLALGVLRPFILEAFVMPTQSMIPTIQPGDRFIVNKLLHPRRWDLVAYYHTDVLEDGPRRSVYCKRLIAFPGERLRFENGSIYINDQLMPAPPIIAGQCHANIDAEPSSRNRYHDGQTILLGPDEYFLLGDNLTVSADSRWYGPTDGRDLLGVVDIFYWPLGHARVLR